MIGQYSQREFVKVLDWSGCFPYFGLFGDDESNSACDGYNINRTAMVLSVSKENAAATTTNNEDDILYNTVAK